MPSLAWFTRLGSASLQPITLHDKGTSTSFYSEPAAATLSFREFAHARQLVAPSGGAIHDATSPPDCCHARCVAGKHVRAVGGFAAAVFAGAAAAVAGGGSLAIAAIAGASGAVGAFAPGWVDSSNERARHRSELGALAGPPPSASPSGLLRADRGVVPFVGREEELTTLLAWCLGLEPDPLRLITGSGGVGKTRLADRLAERLIETGWTCKHVGDGLEAQAWDAAMLATGRPVLLIVDYAETRSDLPVLLRSMASEPTRARVLMLARAAGEWWDALKGLEEPIRAALEAAGPMCLDTGLSAGLSDLEIAAGAIPHFARALAVNEPPLDTSLMPQAPNGETPVLVLHAAALLSVLNASLGGRGASKSLDQAGAATVDSVLKALIGHERRFWLGSLPTSLAEIGTTGCSSAVALACLAAPTDLKQAQHTLTRVPELADMSPAAQRSAARWLKSIYPPADGGYWGSLAPDLVAEHYVCEVFAEFSDLPSRFLAGLEPQAAISALTVLSRAAEHHPGAVAAVESALRENSAGLAGPAMRVAIETGGALGSVLARVFSDVEAPRAVLVAIGLQIPDYSVTLAALNDVVTERITAQLRTDGDGLAYDTAFWLLKRSQALLHVGRAAEALGPLERAVKMFRQLEEADLGRYSNELAGSLDDLGICYSELRRYPEALTVTEQAAEKFRELAEQDHARHGGDLARCLSNLGARLVEMDRPADAVEVGKQAVDLHRGFAERVDPGDYAGALTNLANWLSRLGRYSDALPLEHEAVHIRQHLASADPDQHLGDLARSLKNYGLSLLALGRPSEALPYVQMAVAAHYKLSELNPGAYLESLASSLNDLGVLLLKLGSADAVPPLAAAAEIYRQIDEEDCPGAERAQTLINLGGAYAVAGESEQAQAAAQEAVSVLRRLDELEPSQLPLLAGALHCLAFAHFELGQLDEAVPLTAEAVDIFRGLARDDPNSYQEKLASSLCSLGVYLATAGRPAQALDLAEQAADVYRNLVTQGAKELTAALADALDNVGTILMALGRTQEAERIYYEANQLR